MVAVMGYPKYKEWMGETNRMGDVFRRGANEFVKYAKRCRNDEEFPCTCARCKNGKVYEWKTVELHLLRSGMQDSYRFWSFHGELKVPFVPDQPSQHPSTSRIDEEGDDVDHNMLEDLVDDAYGVYEAEENEVTDDVEDSSAREDNTIKLDDDYQSLKFKATQPLYSGCEKDQTTLHAMVGLHSLKTQYGLSGNSVTGILKWVKGLLPKVNTLPNSYPVMKNSLKGLGMKYKSIHACVYDCILYRKEYENLDRCPVCDEPRYVQSTSKEGTSSKVPQKVLKYFPVGPRLKRFFTVPWIAEAMTWHARAEVGGNIMRHPIDSTAWRRMNYEYPDFAREQRNIRLAISTDGFNPFGNLSTNQSVWPVILAPLNLPPSQCMRPEFLMMALLIHGLKAPSEDIDIYLAPLVEELNELWEEGVKSFDSFRKEEFTLKAMLMWAIHDFPAYGTLSGCVVHGYLGCPICGEETESLRLSSSLKNVYHCHRRFLPPAHSFRFEKASNFLLGGVEHRLPPRQLSGSEIESKSSECGPNMPGKNPKFKNVKHKKTPTGNETEIRKAWSRRSILFDLPYWKKNPVRHVLDVMHAEKNFAEHIVGTCLGGSHSKDGENARKDLKTLKLKPQLWLKEDSRGRTIIPPGAFTLTSEERKVLLDTIYNLKGPSTFSSNLQRIVNYATHDLHKCKSHDWHVIMQLVPLLFKHCFSKHKDLRRAIMQISITLSLLCEKVVNREHIVAAKLAVNEAICVLEKYFPPAFFDISVHLLVHLCDEALLCGPVRYRWMYPFERLMKVFKDYVKNTRYIAGSIAEEYITVESSIYTREYMPDSTSVDDTDEFLDDGGNVMGKRVKLTSLQHEQVARYLFDTHEDVEEWKK